MARATVLVVEDYPDLRSSLCDLLRDNDFAVIEARDERHALAELAKGPVDLICTDLVLAEGSGYAVMDYARASETLRDIPILVMSGRSSPCDRAFAEEAGAHVILIKPFEPDEFLGCVQRLIGKKPLRIASSTEAA